MELTDQNVEYDLNRDCRIVPSTFYESSLGTQIALPEWEAVLVAAVLSLVVILTMVGNALVVISILQSPRLRVPQNYFLLSLAVADLTVAVIVMPPSILNHILGRWHFGLLLCKVWLTSDIFCFTASILNMCAIALDRYWAITDPINYAYHRTSKHVFLNIACVWVIAAIISSPPLFGWNDWPSDEEWTHQVCAVHAFNQGFIVYSSLGSFYIPGFIMTVVYIEILFATKTRLRARARNNSMRQAALATTPDTSSHMLQVPKDVDANTKTFLSIASSSSAAKVAAQDLAALTAEVSKNSEAKRKTGKKFKHHLLPLPLEDSVTDAQYLEDSQLGPDNVTSASHVPRADTERPGPVYAFHDEKKRISLSKERKAARTLGIIMGVFVLCWLPFALLYVIPASFKCDLEKTTTFFTWLGYVNSALNPIIYTIFNMDFRRAFKKILHIP